MNIHFVCMHINAKCENNSPFPLASESLFSYPNFCSKNEKKEILCREVSFVQIFTKPSWAQSDTIKKVESANVLSVYGYVHLERGTK